MRVLMKIQVPNEPMNTLIKEGKASATIGRLMDEVNPEAIYFTTLDGERGAIAIVNVTEASQLPRFAEPFFLALNARCDFSIVMSKEDLAKSGLDKLGASWR